MVANFHDASNFQYCTSDLIGVGQSAWGVGDAKEAVSTTSPSERSLSIAEWNVSK